MYVKWLLLPVFLIYWETRSKRSSFGQHWSVIPLLSKSSQSLSEVTKLPPLKMPSYILILAGLTKQFKIKGGLWSGPGCTKGIFKVTLCWICFRLVFICFSTWSLGICTTQCKFRGKDPDPCLWLEWLQAPKASCIFSRIGSRASCKMPCGWLTRNSITAHSFQKSLSCII